MWTANSALELRVEKLMERVDQAGVIQYADPGDQHTALGWLTPGMELVPRTGDPRQALEQLVALRSVSLAAVGARPDGLQVRAEQPLAGTSGEVSSE